MFSYWVQMKWISQGCGHLIVASRGERPHLCFFSLLYGRPPLLLLPFHSLSIVFAQTICVSSLRSIALFPHCIRLPPNAICYNILFYWKHCDIVLEINASVFWHSFKYIVWVPIIVFSIFAAVCQTNLRVCYFFLNPVCGLWDLISTSPLHYNPSHYIRICLESYRTYTNRQVGHCLINNAPHTVLYICTTVVRYRLWPRKQEHNLAQWSD